MKKYSKTVVASLFVWPLTMLMAHLFGESVTAGFHAIAILWPVSVLLMIIDTTENSKNINIA